MKLSTSTGDFAAYTQHQSEAIGWIAQSGFRYIDYNFATDCARKNGIYGGDFDNYVDGIKRRADELGVAFVQAHAPAGQPFVQGWDELVEQTVLCVKACAGLGIKHLVVHSAYAPDLSVEETIEKNKEFYTPILRAAEEHDVYILTENFNKMTKPNVFWIDNATDLLRLIEYVDHPLFQAVWDTGHANLQELAQDEELRLLGSHVRALHVQDNLGDRDTHLAPYMGTLNLDAVMHGLQEIGFHGYFNFEVGPFFAQVGRRRVYEADKRLRLPPLELRLKAEELLYEIGKCALEAYNCFEE